MHSATGLVEDAYGDVGRFLLTGDLDPLVLSFVEVR